VIDPVVPSSHLFYRWRRWLRCGARPCRLVVTYRLKYHVRRRAKAILVRRPKPDAYSRTIAGYAEANELVHQIVLSGGPALVSRIGAAELSCVRHFVEKRQSSIKPAYPHRVASRMRMNAGFFPATDDYLDSFCQHYIRAASEIDVLGVWRNQFEQVVANQICPSASLVPLRALEPYFHPEPWSRALAGKTVLVVHPFADSILQNYGRNRPRIFVDQSVLPPFDLRLIRAVQSIAGQRTGYATWFEALDDMMGRMDAQRFDVCIIGAGAYGLPLAAHAKRTGKVAIHLGGATQILFGVRGRRWDTDDVSHFYNQWWVRPTSTETPSDARSVEDGCYW
jgi:hypothetical protein